MPSAPLPTIADVHAARERIARFAVVTPLIEHPVLNERVGGRILLKAENLQRVGAFKFRGAYNACSQVDRQKYPGGVVACSSGNHAQGVAAAAALLGLKSVIVMPADSPKMKLARTRASGGEVVTYDRATEDRDAIAAELCRARHGDLVHAYDDARVISGQGTVGLEIMEQAKAIGAKPDLVLACCAGGGLVGGISIAVKAADPNCAVMAVEPVGFDRLARSLSSGTRQRNTRMAGSICDALLAPVPGVLTFALALKNLAGGVAVTDDEARAAMRFAFTELKLVLEPGGGVALAAILAGKVQVAGRTTVAVLSGGNVDAALFAEIIQAT